MYIVGIGTIRWTVETLSLWINDMCLKKILDGANIIQHSPRFQEPQSFQSSRPNRDFADAGGHLELDWVYRLASGLTNRDPSRSLGPSYIPFWRGRISYLLWSLVYVKDGCASLWKCSLTWSRKDQEVRTFKLPSYERDHFGNLRAKYMICPVTLNLGTRGVVEIDVLFRLPRSKEQ